VADEVRRVLKKLQVEARSNSAPDDQGHAIWNLPEELATEDFVSIVLDGAGLTAMENAKAEVLKDQRLEYLDSREVDDLLWRFIHGCLLDRSHDKVKAFMDEHGREVQEETCYLPIEHLTVTTERQILGVRLLPLSSEEVPSPGRPWFKLDKPVGGLIAVPVTGTKHGLMAARASVTAEHALRVLRVALKLAYPAILDRQVRFRLAGTWTFSEEASGFAVGPDRVYGFSLGDNLPDLFTQVVLGLRGDPRSTIERQAVLAVDWINRGLFASERVVALLFHFFALEALLGDKSEGLKGPVIARRRAMLAAAMDTGFLHPHANYFLYENVRSAAVHGELSDEVTEDTVQTFCSDVRTALQQFLGYAAKERFTKKSDLVRSLDNHPKSEELLEWLRENGGPLWDKYFEKLNAKNENCDGLAP
jgi:hypothetical protein